MQRIEKPVSLIVSAGRTGTRFFGESLESVIRDCASYHEPDVLVWSRGGKLEVIRRFGPYQTILGKLLNRTGLRATGLKYLSGRVGHLQTARALLRQRRRFYERQDAGLVVEAHYQWFPLLPVLPDVFAHYKAAVVVRDPRAWVASAHSWGLWWSSADLVRRLRLLRLTPDLVGDKEIAAEWPDMDGFDRLAWSWATINRELVERARDDANIRVFRFEDLFLGARREDHLADFLAFVSRFDDRRFEYSLERLLAYPQLHASGGDSRNAWHDWARDRCRRLDRFCGPLMRELGYVDDDAWHRKLVSMEKSR